MFLIVDNLRDPTTKWVSEHKDMIEIPSHPIQILVCIYTAQIYLAKNA
jgi:hypothetical protein